MINKETHIIISGVTSFLGKWFYHFLQKQNIPIVVIARSTSNIDEIANHTYTKVYRYKSTTLELITEIEAQTFKGAMYFEFAWQGVFGTHRNETAQFTQNIPLMLNSVELANHLGVLHWVGIGSQAEYGNLNKTISEAEECKPTTLYGKAKLACSQLTAQLCDHFQIKHSWLRLFSMYGPNDNHAWFIPYIIEKMLRNEPIETTLAEQYWDYLYVQDAVNALYKISPNKGLGICNFASGKAVQLKEIIEAARIFTKSESVVHYGAIPYRPDQVMYMKADISKLSQALHWVPHTDIQTGIKLCIEQKLR